MVTVPSFSAYDSAGNTTSARSSSSPARKSANAISGSSPGGASACSRTVTAASPSPAPAVSASPGARPGAQPASRSPRPLVPTGISSSLAPERPRHGEQRGQGLPAAGAVPKPLAPDDHDGLRGAKRVGRRPDGVVLGPGAAPPGRQLSPPRSAVASAARAASPAPGAKRTLAVAFGSSELGRLVSVTTLAPLRRAALRTRRSRIGASSTSSVPTTRIAPAPSRSVAAASGQGGPARAPARRR